MKRSIIAWCLVTVATIIHYSAYTQADSCNLQISLLTGSPGEELYSTFGHSAIRVIDSASRQDLVFNYGTFEFNPDFYGKFVRGKLNYFLSVAPFEDFVAEFQYEQRNIYEHPLQLSCAEKQRLYLALQQNAREENKYYKYDFLFDNCATRIRDIVKKNTDAPVTFKNILPAEVPTFRNLLYNYLNKGGQYWSKFGIDILLGSKLDVKVTNEQAMFLPDYLMNGFDSALVGNKKLVEKGRVVLNSPVAEKDSPWFTPMVLFSALLVIVVLLQLSKNRIAIAALSVFDRLFFFLLGALGVLLLFMWFGTDHVVCRNNFNLLWAFPLHIIVVFVMGRKKKWVKKYFQAILLLSVLLAIAWWFIPQQLNTAIAPILALIIIRSYFRSKFY